MSELKATPGPWQFMNGEDIFGPLGGDSGDGLNCDDSDGWKIAEVGCYSSFSDGEPVELSSSCRIANAHLIAAAPELYAALNRIDFDDGMIAEALGEDLQNNINDALAKARGEV